MERFTLARMKENDIQTLGSMWVYDTALSILELPWLNNKRFISRIPAGIYKVIQHISPKFGLCFKVLDVPDREDILFHPMNFYTDTEGCIGPGLGYYDINNDGHLDVIQSGNALKYMLAVMPEEWELEILDDFEIIHPREYMEEKGE